MCSTSLDILPFVNDTNDYWKNHISLILAKLQNKQCKNGDELIKFIVDMNKYNNRQITIEQLKPLSLFLNKYYPEDDTSTFWNKTIPYIASLALHAATVKIIFDDDENEETKNYSTTTTNNIEDSIAPFGQLHCHYKNCLKSVYANESSTLTLSKKDVASFIAVAFFCLTYDNNSSTVRSFTRNRNFPEFNCLELYLPLKISAMFSYNDCQSSKVRMLIQYFDTLSNRSDDLLSNCFISYQRKVLSALPTHKEWSSKLNSSTLSSTNKLTLCDMIVKEDGSMTEEVEESVQVDFANEYVGGGAFSSAALQEEIRFIISPEALLSMLIFEKMNHNESIELNSIEIYSKHKGYGRSLRYVSKFNPNNDEDISSVNQLKLETLVAMDAISYANSSSSEQYKPNEIIRELNKSYCAFANLNNLRYYNNNNNNNNNNNSDNNDNSKITYNNSITTGNWGCGGYCGDSQLKSMIQWISASLLHYNHVIYYSYSNKKLNSTDNDLNLNYIISIYKSKPVYHLFNAITSYKYSASCNLFSHLISYANDNNLV